MEEDEMPFETVENTFDALRSAVEERNYTALAVILREQRSLLSQAPASDPRIQALALKGSALISWALTLVRIQHAGYTQELITLLNTRHLNAQYAEADRVRPERISLNG